MTLKGSAFEAIEKINKPFSLRWHPGNPGRWEAIKGEEGVRASSTSPDVAIAMMLDRYQKQQGEKIEWIRQWPALMIGVFQACDIVKA